MTFIITITMVPIIINEKFYPIPIVQHPVCNIHVHVHVHVHAHVHHTIKKAGL